LSRCVLVVGLPRSGTSCIAGVLHHLGVNMGETLYHGPSDWNAQGSFLDAEFEALMSKLFRGTSNPSRLDIEDRSAIRQEVRDWVANRLRQRPIWGLKTYRLVYLFPLLDRLDDVRIIAPERKLSESVESVKLRTGVIAEWREEDPRRSQYVADRFARLKAERDKSLTETKHPIHAVSFDALLDDPATQVGLIASFIGVPVTQAAVSFVDPSQRRVRHAE